MAAAVPFRQATRVLPPVPDANPVEEGCCASAARSQTVIKILVVVAAVLIGVVLCALFPENPLVIVLSITLITGASLFARLWNPSTGAPPKHLVHSIISSFQQERTHTHHLAPVVLEAMRADADLANLIQIILSNPDSGRIMGSRLTSTETAATVVNQLRQQIQMGRAASATFGASDGRGAPGGAYVEDVSDQYEGSPPSSSGEDQGDPPLQNDPDPSLQEDGSLGGLD